MWFDKLLTARAGVKVALKLPALIHCGGAHVAAAVGPQVDLEDMRSRKCLNALIQFALRMG